MNADPQPLRSAQPLSFTATVRAAGSTALIDLTGTLDGAAGPSLQGAYGQAMDAAPKRVIFNFEQVGHINSTGIALLVGLLARARREGTHLGAFGLSDHYAEIFRITRLSEYMRVSDGEEQALAPE